MTKSLYQQLVDSKKDGQKKFALLIDPDKVKAKKLENLLQLISENNIDYLYVGGSLIVNDMLDHVIQTIKSNTKLPVILFPGNSFQLSYKADAILFLSLISGRNPELLIGNHVISAPFLKVSPLEIIPTGYMLIEGGTVTSVQYMSNTTPIPSSKNDIAMCTAMAGEMLGLKQIYLDAGSGALHTIPTSMIESISSVISVPLIVGGGINTPEKAMVLSKAGADIIVVGNAIEKDPSLLSDIVHAVKSQSTNLINS